MGRRLIPVHRDKLIKILNGFGFVAEHGTKHIKMVKKGHPSPVPIPRHSNEAIGGQPLNHILKEARVSKEDYEKARLRIR